MPRLTIRRPDDMHVHLRSGDELEAVLPFTARRFARAVAMPNLVPPVADGEAVTGYWKDIVRHAPSGFRPLMTFKLLNGTSVRTVEGARAAGAVAGKLYPEGVTTNSEDGVADVRSVYPALEAMETAGLVLCVHGELPGSFVMDRERDYLPVLSRIASDFPKLRIVLEHVTTAEAVDWVRAARDGIAATITIHHMMTTLDDVLGGSLDPHAFCKPVPKRPSDREALISAAFSGDPRFFFGSDSAPHSIVRKEQCGCAGVFSSPVALEALVQLFDERCCLDRLEPFVSEHGARFYGLPLNEGRVELASEPFNVPSMTRGYRPFLGGRTVSWSLA